MGLFSVSQLFLGPRHFFVVFRGREMKKVRTASVGQGSFTQHFRFLLLRWFVGYVFLNSRNVGFFCNCLKQKTFSIVYRWNLVFSKFVVVFWAGISSCSSYMLGSMTILFVMYGLGVGKPLKLVMWSRRVVTFTSGQVYKVWLDILMLGSHTKDHCNWNIFGHIFSNASGHTLCGEISVAKTMRSRIVCGRLLLKARDRKCSSCKGCIVYDPSISMYRTSKPNPNPTLALKDLTPAQNQTLPLQTWPGVKYFPSQTLWQVFGNTARNGRVHVWSSHHSYIQRWI